MAIEIRMPQWGMGMSEGTIIEWYKAEGDHVEVDEPIAAIETSKVTEDLVAPESGTLTRLAAAAGDTLECGELLAIIE